MSAAATPESKMPAHEPDVVAVPKIVRMLAVLLGAIVVSAAASAWLLGALGGSARDTGASRVGAFAMPRLQSAPQLDIAAYRAQKRAELDSYRWIDRERGIVAIPIARAMELLAERQ